MRALRSLPDLGARSPSFAADRCSAWSVLTNTKNTPIEALERAFPLRVLRYRLRQGSGGAGLASVGEGIERDLQVLVDATVSLITERRVSQPWGLAGGEPGAVGENWLLPGGDEARAERLPGEGRAPAGQVHDRPQGWRRPPEAGARRRRLGPTAALVSSEAGPVPQETTVQFRRGNPSSCAEIAGRW